MKDGKGVDGNKVEDEIVLIAPYYITVMVGECEDLWAEVKDIEELEFEVGLLKERNFEYKVKDSKGEELII